MPVVEYNTSRKFPGPWLLTEEDLEQLERILREILKEETKLYNRRLTVRAKERFRSRMSHRGDVVEPGREKEEIAEIKRELKAADAASIFSPVPRLEISATLRTGVTIKESTIKAVAQHRDLAATSTKKLEVSLEGRADCTVSIETGDSIFSAPLQIDVRPPTEARTESYFREICS
jgi:small-conductance mechanosensitive channel